jgi:2-C-methyl-D-erythritol 4-phosphate cytidylyltransferase / 2-C-methyl-D-erythritol 2,4-cyclodiphosphate synthase
MNTAIIIAGGKGMRMHSRLNKLLLLLNKEPIIWHTLKAFQACGKIDKIILVVRPDDKEKFKALVKKNKFDKISKIVDGGKERQDSSYNGLKEIKSSSPEDIIVFHNAANPFIDNVTLIDCIDAAIKYGAAVAGFPAKDTIKIVQDGFVKQTIDRKLLWQVQTPQAMKYFLAKKGFEKAIHENYIGTDDVSLVERLGASVKVVNCPRENIKITSPYDLLYANRLESASRIGIGQDSHRFSNDKTKKLVIGGIIIEGQPGFDANSDGDVILHALFNAISSAIGFKSLGFYADKMCKKGITDSRKYLDFILGKVEEKKLKLSNIALMLEGKNPKIDPIIDKIRASLSNILKINPEFIGIAATSGEGLTHFGKGNGIQCFAVVSIK